MGDGVSIDSSYPTAFSIRYICKLHPKQMLRIFTKIVVTCCIVGMFPLHDHDRNDFSFIS